MKKVIIFCGHVCFAKKIGIHCIVSMMESRGTVPIVKKEAILREKIMVFEDFARSKGLIVNQYITTGKWLRFPTINHPHKRNGSLKLDESGLIGWVRDWASDECHTWKANCESAKKIAYDPFAHARRNHKIKEEQKFAAINALAYYKDAKMLEGGHLYLEKKKLTVEGCSDLRVDANGNLVIPILDRRMNLQSLQLIDPFGQKKFWPGAKVKEGFFLLRRKQNSMTILCEGFATGLTLFQAIPDSNVVICFSASNLLAVSKMSKSKIIIAADNDKQTELKTGKNIGVESANKCRQLLNCRVMIPNCKLGTDWNDLRNEILSDIEDKNSYKKLRNFNPVQQANEKISQLFRWG